MQACQALHAALRFAVEHPDVTADWISTSEHLVLLAVAGEYELQVLVVDAAAYRQAPFREPDLGGELTAVAFEPAAAGRLSCLPLALRREVMT